MKKRLYTGTIFLAVFTMLSCLFSIAQTPAPTPPDVLENAWNIGINGNFSNLSQSANNNGFQVSEAFRVAQHWTFRSDQFLVMNPSIVVVTAGPEYRFSLQHLLAKSTFAANASKLEAFVNVGAGTARSSTVADNGTTTLSAAKFAYKIGGGIDILVNSTLSLRPLDISYVRAGMLNNGGQILGNHVQAAAGLGLRF